MDIDITDGASEMSSVWLSMYTPPSGTARDENAPIAIRSSRRFSHVSLNFGSASGDPYINATASGRSAISAQPGRTDTVSASTDNAATSSVITLYPIVARTAAVVDLPERASPTSRIALRPISIALACSAMTPRSRSTNPRTGPVR